MESLGWDIKSQTFFSNNYTWFRIIPPFWSFVNQNIIKFLVFFSWQISRLALNFRWWCGKSYFCPFDDFPDTISLLSSSLGKVLLNSLRLFFSDLSHHLIDSIYHLFHFHLISQKNLQFYHIWIGQYHFFKGTLMFLPTSILIKLRHLLHPITVFSYFLSTLFFSNLFIIIILYLIIQ